MELHVFQNVIDDSLHRELAAARAAGDAAIWEEVGGLIVVRYQDVERFSHDARLAGLGLSLFDAMGIGDGALRRWYSQLMFTNEGDAHHRTRRLVARAFTPRAVEHHREFARLAARDRFDAIVEAGSGDLVDALATLPLAVICRLLGVPDEQVADFVGYGDALSPSSV